MRLIQTTTLLLEEFIGDKFPKYAILSHTWGKQEVSFHEWLNQETITKKKGYEKILRACAQARSDGYQYLWVDTVCIDKSSSSELSEAINSMFSWYQLSEVCYAYLADVKETRPSTHLDSSRWFTRGWTLQELIAPEDVVFFSATWTKLGSKRSLSNSISKITGIDDRILTHTRSALHETVARRISWVATRVTTRSEDMAYCMLGLFGISMPLLYGEGPKAFIRLQEELLKSSNDHTLFCWTRDKTIRRSWGSLLAPSPAAFRYSESFIESSMKRIAPYSMTNFGLSITLPMLDTWNQSIGIMDATGEGTDLLGIPLRESANPSVYHRGHFPPCPIHVINPVKFQTFEHARRSIYISQNEDTIANGPSFRYAAVSTARRSFLLTFKNRKIFESYTSIPSDVFAESKSLFTVEEGRGGVHKTLIQSIDNGRGVFSYGLLQLKKVQGDTCNILFGVRTNRYGNTFMEAEHFWSVEILSEPFPVLSESALQSFVRRHVQQKDFITRGRSRTVGSGIEILSCQETNIGKNHGHDQWVMAVVII